MPQCKSWAATRQYLAQMSNKRKTTGRNEDGKPALVPNLRFPEFRAAEGWESGLMGSVYSFKGNNSLSRDKLNYAAGSVKNMLISIQICPPLSIQY